MYVGHNVVLILVVLYAIGDIEERLGLTWKWPRKERGRSDDAGAYIRVPA